jgi:hypothetical protein
VFWDEGAWDKWACRHSISFYLWVGGGLARHIIGVGIKGGGCMDIGCMHMERALLVAYMSVFNIILFF